MTTETATATALPLISLPECRYRSREIRPGVIKCSSPKVMMFGDGMPAAMCAKCEIRDHAQIPDRLLLKAAPLPELPPIPPDDTPCRHLGPWTGELCGG